MTDVPSNDFIFVSGCPRSGTYLLQMLMNQAFPVAIPVEAQFVRPFLRYHFLWGNLTRERNRRRLLEAIYQFIEIFTHTVLWSRSETRNPNGAREFTLLSTYSRSDDIVARSQDFSDIVRHLFAAYADRHGARHSGEKLGSFAPVPIETIACVIPHLKVIHVVRDGRDVSLSWRRTWHGPSSVMESAWSWVNHVKQKQAWGTANPGRYLEVKYEDVVTDTLGALNRIADFIGENRIDVVPNLATNDMARVLAGVETHGSLAGRIDSTNVAKWHRKMPEADVLRFEYLAGDTLDDLGYPCRFERRQRESVKLQVDYLSARVRSYLSSTCWKRAIRDILPMLIFLSQLLGVRLSRIVGQ